MRLKTLNGAPLRANLDFSPETLLHPDAATQFIYQSDAPSASVEDMVFKWRHITAREQRLRSGWSQPYLPKASFNGSNADCSFVLPGEGASLETNEEDTTDLNTAMTIPEAHVEDSEFVHHSLIFHDTLLSSQIASGGAADRTVSDSSFLSISFNSTTSADLDSFQESNNHGPILQVPTALKLTMLGALPSAAHLRSIYPQTPTPNILCVLTAPPEEREVVVRKSGNRMRLHEITVADDTKSGFKVSFWQRPSNNNDPQSVMNQLLQRIKAGDILLLRNIALHTFRDTVYGQSLNLSITRVRTTIEVLMSGGSISSRQLGILPGPVVTTFMRVKKWANSHIASDVPGRKKRKGESQTSNKSTKRLLRDADLHNETLPPDTLEFV